MNGCQRTKQSGSLQRRGRGRANSDQTMTGLMCSAKKNFVTNCHKAWDSLRCALAKIESGGKAGLMNELRVWLCRHFRLDMRGASDGGFSETMR